MSKNYAQALTFLLSKAEGITISYDKARNWSKTQTRMGILHELNKVHDVPNSTLEDIEAVEAKLDIFMGHLLKIPLKNMNITVFWRTKDVANVF